MTKNRKEALKTLGTLTVCWVVLTTVAAYWLLISHDLWFILSVPFALGTLWLTMFWVFAVGLTARVMWTDERI